VAEVIKKKRERERRETAWRFQNPAVFRKIRKESKGGVSMFV
jgi:hypothetical protein